MPLPSTRSFAASARRRAPLTGAGYGNSSYQKGYTKTKASYIYYSILGHLACISINPDKIAYVQD
jgi:hypothetical protein